MGSDGDRGRPVAVVEIGSGSVKLLITDGAALAGDGGDRVRRSIKTRLLPGDDGRFADDALAATADAFDRFATLLDGAGVDRSTDLAVVATAVARGPVDPSPLLALGAEAFGVPVEVLSGLDEAELAWAGAVAGRDLPGPLTVIDIGSASTEVAVGPSPSAASIVAPGPAPVASPVTDPAMSDPAMSDPVVAAAAMADPVRTWSLPIGARVLSREFLHHDPPGPDELSSALSVVELHYADLRRELPGIAEALETGTLIGVGAIGQIAAVEIGLTDLEEGVDGHRLTKPAVEEVFRTLATEDRVDRAANPGLLPEHVDDIVGGLCVLVEFLRRLPAKELVVSERDLRHGRAARLLTKG